MNTYYTCRIDTTEYSGNFERQMVAFITGLVGECQVGEEDAEIADKQLSPYAAEWFLENVVFLPDEHGCYRPAAIAPTPGWSNDGMGKHTKGEGLYPAYQSVLVRFDTEPPKLIQELIRERAKLYLFKDLIDVVFERVTEQTTREQI